MLQVLQFSPVNTKGEVTWSGCGIDALRCKRAMWLHPNGIFIHSSFVTKISVLSLLYTFEWDLQKSINLLQEQPHSCI